MQEETETFFSSTFLHTTLTFFLQIYLFNLFRCCMQSFSGCGEQGLLFVAVRGLLIAVASLVAEHGPQARWLQQLRLAGSVVAAHGLSSCGSRALEHKVSSCGVRAQLLRGMWNHPGPGIEPLSPALLGGFSTTAPPGKSPLWLFKRWMVFRKFSCVVVLKYDLLLLHFFLLLILMCHPSCLWYHIRNPINNWTGYS